MIRLGKLTDYGVVVLTAMAGAPAVIHTAASLSDRTAVPAPTVQKILKLLARGRVLTSVRGAAGGYTLARAADRITVADIISAIEGPIALTDCVDGAEGTCGVERLCPMRGNWDKVNRAVRKALEEVSLTDMAPPTAPPADVGGATRLAARAAI